MGNRNSHADDETPLIRTDNQEMDCALFEELHLVVIGSHCAGKNAVGNAILQKKAFTIWGGFKKSQVKNGGEICKRKITVIRTPGWKGDLHASVNKQKKIKYEIVNSVMSHFDNGPHAILLALDVDSTITDKTRDTLEILLNKELWDHTIVIFTHGEKLKDKTIDNAIRVNQLDDFMRRCGRRYHVLKKNTRGKQNAEFIETIEYFIADKEASVKFHPSDREVVKTELVENNSLIKRLKRKIDNLTAFKVKYAGQDDSCQQLINSKDAEIRRLKAALQKREQQICKLEKEIAGLQETVASSIRCLMCEKKDEEIRLLQEELSKLKNEKITHKDVLVAHVSSHHRSQFTKLNLMDRSHQSQPFCRNSFEMQRLSSARPQHERHQDFLRGWTSNLNKILNELTEDQFKKMKNLLEFRDEWRIPAGMLDGQDRASLTKLLVQSWGEQLCIINTRDIMKEIPRNDKVIQDLLMPFLEHFGESW
ncbi:uncharacterized protein [Salminus brasiliensis]|uniref:uncharacterized protein n=1 Tax=Salminus brasiliensis TaxID=930266 RepID=UPI003B839075